MEKGDELLANKNSLKFLLQKHGSILPARTEFINAALFVLLALEVFQCTVQKRFKEPTVLLL